MSSCQTILVAWVIIPRSIRLEPCSARRFMIMDIRRTSQRLSARMIRRDKVRRYHKSNRDGFSGYSSAGGLMRRKG